MIGLVLLITKQEGNHKANVMKPDVFIPGLIFLIWGLLLFPLKSKGSKNQNKNKP